MRILSRTCRFVPFLSLFLLFSLFSRGWAEGELVNLHLKDGTDVRILHTETREDGVTGKVGAFVVQFDRDKIESFSVPAANRLLDQARDLLGSLEGIGYGDLSNSLTQIQGKIHSLQDLQTRLKWLVPGIAAPIPDLEMAESRISGVLKDAEQVETLISALNALSESSKSIENTWIKTLSRTTKLIESIPFPEKREEFQRRTDEIVAKRNLFLDRSKEPFFQEYEKLDLSNVNQKDYDNFKELAAQIENPILKNDSIAMLDRIRMRIPKPEHSPKDPEKNGGAPTVRETQTETVAAGASETSGMKGPFSTLRNLDPKLIGIAVGALFLVFVFPAMLKKLKGKTKRDLPSPATIIPNNAQERVSESDASSLPEEPVSPPLKEPEPVTSISALNQAEAKGGGEGEEGEEKEEEWVPLESVISSPAVESPQIENDIDESPEESLIEESDRGSTEEAFEELDVQSPSDDLFYEEPKVDLDSVIEGGDPLGLENETKGSDEETPDEGSSPPVEKPDRRMMEDLFDALEKTAEARLAERSEWSQASEPDETDELKTDDLAEPEVSLDSVFGFDPDISQFLEESPDIHPPDDSADSTQEDAETAEREPLNQPPEDERWEEPEHEDPESFQIQVGSGYEDSAGESSDLWDDPENDTPTESLQESLEDDSAPLQYSNGKHEPYDQTVGDVNDKSPASQESDGPEMPNKTLNASDEDEDFICPMTGVFSRTFFDKQFPKTFDRCRRDRHPLTLVLLGIDHFEDCPGDDEDEVQKEVLTSVAESLRKSVRTRDILARFDRSTFAVLMLQVKPTSAFPLALKIRNDLKKLNVTTPEGFPVDLTLSFGMNCVLEDDRATTREELLEGAWESLCRAAMEGGNQIVLHGIEGDSRL